MFTEFFCKRDARTLLISWGGLAVVIGYAVFLAVVKAQINEFYSTFYDLMQRAGSIVVLGEDEEEEGEILHRQDAYDLGSGDAINRTTTATSSATPSTPSTPSTLAECRAEVWAQLAHFAVIVAPLVLVSPISKWMRSAWAFSWRAALMRSYLSAWDISLEPIEGASQRLHEDTQRFCTALQGCLATVLDAIFTLAVFTPILLNLSVQIAPPVALGPLRAIWLWLLALVAAMVGLGGAMTFGQKLVQLEVNNQRVEAAYRRDLVLLETTPAVIVGMPVLSTAASTRSYDYHPHTLHDAHPPVRHSRRQYAPSLYFGLTLKRLSKNYHALFRHFTLLNGWLGLYDQIMVILPYLVAAPLLFAETPELRITLGTLVQMSNSFDKVFSSLSVVAENWGAVNEFRSVLQRLREFEAKLYLRSGGGGGAGGGHSHRGSSGGGQNGGGLGGGNGDGNGNQTHEINGTTCNNCLLPAPDEVERSDALTSHTRNQQTELTVVQGSPVTVRHHHHYQHAVSGFEDSEIENVDPCIDSQASRAGHSYDMRV